MDIQISGKKMDIGSSLNSYISEGMNEIAQKYFDKTTSGEVYVEKERGKFLVKIILRTGNKLLLQTSAENGDVYQSAQGAMTKIAKRLRRYKRRLKSHNNADSLKTFTFPTSPANLSIIQSFDEDNIDEKGEDSVEKDVEGDSPAIIAETKTDIEKLSVVEAVAKLELESCNFKLFKEIQSGRINLVYVRADKNIGWIDPYEK